jgi:hypothetical protein
MLKMIIGFTLVTVARLEGELAVLVKGCKSIAGQLKNLPSI